MAMPDKGFRTITVTEQLYQQVKQRAKKENKSAASFVSEALEIILYVEEKFGNYVPYIHLISLDNDEVIIRDSKMGRVVGVKAKTSDDGVVRFYCEADDMEYCPHTAFATALPQVRTALKR